MDSLSHRCPFARVVSRNRNLCQSFLHTKILQVQDFNNRDELDPEKPCFTTINRVFGGDRLHYHPMCASHE